MFGAEIAKAMKGLGEQIGPAIEKGIESGAKILGEILAAKLDELHERDERDRAVQGKAEADSRRVARGG